MESIEFNKLGKYIISEFQKGNISFYIDTDLKNSELAFIFKYFMNSYTTYSINTLSGETFLSITDNYVLNYKTNFSNIASNIFNNNFDEYNKCMVINFSTLIKTIIR